MSNEVVKGDERKTNQIVAGLVFVIAFGIYLKTFAPTTLFCDCGEFIPTTYILGVQHAPGSLLFVVVDLLFRFLPI